MGRGSREVQKDGKGSKGEEKSSEEREFRGEGVQRKGSEWKSGQVEGLDENNRTLRRSLIGLIL